MADYRATELEQIELNLGDIRTLESLRQAVVPPYVLIVPFLELPDELTLVRQDSLEEDGIHGCVFTLRAVIKGEGALRVGFRDLRNGDAVIEKIIRVKVR